MELPDPQKELSFPLMRALELRRTKRNWDSAELSLHEISNILWAAGGVTMAQTSKNKSKRTVPSARNSQSVKIFVALKKGLFMYRENNHELLRISEEDIRESLSTQKRMKSAPAGLVFVADYSRLKGYIGSSENQKWFVAGTETGFMSQNVYLYCAAAQLHTAVIGLVDRQRLHDLMGLAEYEKVVFTQVFGRPLKP